MNNKTVDWIIIGLSVGVAALVSFLARTTFAGAEHLPWNVHEQPKLHATLNSITAIFLLVGFIAVKAKNVQLHRLSMFGAILASAIFLVSYVLYHALTDSTTFGGEGFIRYVYFFILITHIILAGIIFPLILITVHRALTNQLDAHRKLAKITFPVWLYVAITGVVVYLMVSPYYGL